jgi:hypothetical protein
MALNAVRIHQFLILKFLTNLNTIIDYVWGRLNCYFSEIQISWTSDAKYGMNSSILYTKILAGKSQWFAK